MNKKAKSKLIERMGDLSANVTSSDEQMAHEFLEQMGINVDEESAYGLSVVNKTHFMAKAQLNKTRDASLISQLQSKIKESIEKNATLAGQILQNTLLSRKASVQFRNIEEWSEQEMREVLSDLDITKLMEDLDKIE
jgi:hypothetical protein